MRGGVGKFKKENFDFEQFSAASIFYDKLNSVLAEAGFDKLVVELCEPFYKKTGRRSIPPGVYFRMIMVVFRARFVLC